MLVPRPIRRALLSCLLLLLSGAAEARVLVPKGEVQEALRELANRPSRPHATARYLLVRSLFDALDPAQVVERLSAIARQEGAPYLAVRGALDLTRYGRVLDEEARERFGFIPVWRTRAGERGVSVASAHSAAVQDARILQGNSTAWRVVSPDGPRASVHLRVPEGGGGVRHFVTELYALRATEVRLRLGVSGAAVVSLDGQWLGEVPAMGFPAVDQLEVPLQLEEGSHRLAVTLATEPRKACELFARLVDPRGHRALFVDARAPSKDLRLAQLTEGEELPGLVAVSAVVPTDGSYRARLRAAAARRALGLPEPLSTQSGLRLEELVQEDAFFQEPLFDAVLATSFLNAEHLRMASLDALVRHAPGAWVRPIAAMVAMERGQNFRALELLSHPQESKVGREAAVLARVQLALVRDRPGAASVGLAGLESRGPASERLLEAHADVALNLGRPDIALPSLRALQASLPMDANARAQLAGVLVELGEEEEAIALLLATSPKDPAVEAFRLQAALLSTRRGDRDRALGLIAQLERDAGDADLLATLARLLQELGEADRAKAVWGQVLRMRPGDPDLRAEWERAQPVNVEAVPYVFAAGELAADLPAKDVDHPFEILGDETHVTVREDGGWRRYDQRVLRVHRVPEGREGRTSSMRFDPAFQQARVLRAEVLRDGLAIPVSSRELYQVSEDGVGFYYDLQELAVVFDDLRPGDVVTIQHRLDSGPQPGSMGRFGLVHSLHETLPKRRIHVAVEGPTELGLQATMRSPVRGGGGSLAIESSSEEGGARRWVVTGQDLPAVAIEPNAPPLQERSATVHVSSSATWTDVVRDYSRQVESTRVVTPKMRAWVQAHRRALSLGPDDEATIALARGMAVGLAREIRYVGLEFGEHGYKPYGTDQVWSRRFGDCKDQSNLLVVLMELAGIEAHLTLVRTRSHGRLQGPLPSLAFFDHAIVYVPQWDTYFDPTSRHHGWGELPPVDQGAQALVIAPAEEAELSVIPATRSNANGMEGSYIVTLGSDGSATLSGKAVFRGSVAADYRARLADEGAREERLEELLNGRYPGLELIEQSMTGLGADTPTFALEFEARVASLAAPSGAGLEVRRPAGLDGHATRWAGASRRATRLELPPPSRHELSFRYVLPVGWGVASLPPEVREEASFGEYEVRWRAVEGSVEVHNRLELRTTEVTPEDYPAFRAFLERYDAALRAPLAVEPKGGDSA